MAPVRGRPFQKGSSGNPTGCSERVRRRMAGHKVMQDIRRQCAEEGLLALAELARSAEDESIRFAAAKELKDTEFGTPGVATPPTQPQEGEGDAGLAELLAPPPLAIVPDNEHNGGSANGH